MNLKVSIIIPCYQEEKYISQCIDSLLNSDFDFEKTNSEILVLDGMSTDKTQEIIESYNLRYPFIKLIPNKNKYAPFALNKGISIAKGEIIIRIDAHCVYPKNYISELVHYHNITDAANIGGCWNTLPGADTKTAKAIQIVMNHPLGMSGGTYRTLKGTIPVEVDTVPFGSWKKTLFEEIGAFDEDFLRDQDYEHNVRLRKVDKKILLLPWLRIDYYARDTFKKAWKMFFQYGYWRPMLNKKHKMITNLRQLVPAFWVLGFFATTISAPFHPIAAMLWMAYILLWLIPVLFVSFKQSLRMEKNLSFVPMIISSFFLIHFSYGLGYLSGFIDVFIFRKKKPNKTTSQSTR